jgi:hypothetical protein
VSGHSRLATVVIAFVLAAVPCYVIIHKLDDHPPPGIDWNAALWSLGASAWLLVLSVLVWFAPRWLLPLERVADGTQALELENEARSNLVGIIGGIAVISGLVFTLYQFHQTQQQTQAQLTLTAGQLSTVRQEALSKRFSDATSALAIRRTSIPAIYALDEVASDAEAYRPPVIKTLSSYVEGGARRRYQADGTPAEAAPVFQQLRVRRPAVQASIDVMGGANARWKDPSRIYTVDVAIVRADLRIANLQTLDLRKAYFTGDDLTGGTTDATTRLDGARFFNSSFRNFHFRDVDLGGVTIQDSDLSGAKLLKVQNLGEDTLKGRITCDEHTTWPVGFRPKPQWRC